MAANAEYVVVPVGTAVLNDSVPDARTGLAVLREAQSLLKSGLTGREVLASLSAKYGVREVIDAIAMAMGQRNLVEAVRKGRLYAPNADPDEAS